ncbi:MAG: hypothetical protein LBR47_07690, partial [Spirochaetaceae bacterium]|nr:hypothetical protein [Spirochaetaceae bacterium]
MGTCQRSGRGHQVSPLFFLPFFGQPEGGVALHVSLLSLGAQGYIRARFISFTSVAAVFGAAELALQ